MFRQSIRQKIVGIAVGLIILVVVTAALSLWMSSRVGKLLDEMTTRYVPAYSHLARANVRSLERGLALRRMVIAKMQTPPDEAGYAARLQNYEQLGPEVEREAQAARQLIIAIINDVTTPSDNAALARIETRIDAAVADLQHRMNDGHAELFAHLQTLNFEGVRRNLTQADLLRDEFNRKIDVIRADMLNQVFASSTNVMADQKKALVTSVIVTALAAIIGLFFAVLVSTGITRPVRRLLEGTREIEAGHLDKPIVITTRDEIGQLSVAFNRMTDQLRHNQRIRETFGRYIDPQIAKGLLDQPALAATEGQRRVMTVLFCDMKGFSTLSEGMTPQGLVKIMNRYLSAMSGPIRNHGGIIDKYIGDAIMAYWGPPFVEESEQARLACLAAIDMTGSIPALLKELPELLGVRTIPMQCDIRIGITTGDALVGSIGSDFMMSYTVMGDTVNLASRLESANKIYGSRSLVSEATAHAAGSAIETREIDRLVVAGLTRPQSVFEIMGRQGELTQKEALLRSQYSEGLAAYRARRWDDACGAFNAALEAMPGDGPSLALLKRIESLRRDPPAVDWDGTWHMDGK
jgi:class 3 adenylate cyclase